MWSRADSLRILCPLALPFRVSAGKALSVLAFAGALLSFFATAFFATPMYWMSLFQESFLGCCCILPGRSTCLRSRPGRPSAMVLDAWWRVLNGAGLEQCYWRNERKDRSTGALLSEDL